MMDKRILLLMVLASAACRSEAPVLTEPVPASPVFTLLAAGTDHTCGATADGTAYCWGSNFNGELGDGTSSPRLKPTEVKTTLKFAALTAASGYSCGIAVSGGTYCWGTSTWGRMTQGTTSSIRFTTPTDVIGGDNFISIATANITACATSGDLSVWCWGAKEDPQAISPTVYPRTIPEKVGTGLVAVIAGGAHICGVNSEGDAYCWGNNVSGEYGDGTTGKIRNGPGAPVAGGFTFTTLRAGENHTCGITGAGATYCWGRNNAGQLGDGTKSNTSVPVRVKNDPGFKILAAGGNHTCGVTNSGQLYCWGSNANGELGNELLEGEVTPRLVAPSLRFTVIRAGASHTCGVTDDGKAYCWGNNTHGQLGDGTTVKKFSPTLVRG